MRDFRFLAFRADPEVGAAIERAAKAADVSISGWIRRVLCAALPESASLPPLPASPRRGKVVIPNPDIAAVADLVAGGAKLTGATIQLAKALREAGHSDGHREMEAVIRSHRAAQADLVRVVERLRGIEGQSE